MCIFRRRSDPPRSRSQHPRSQFFRPSQNLPTIQLPKTGGEARLTVAAAGMPLFHSSRNCVRVISSSKTNPQQDKSSARPPRLGVRWLPKTDREARLTAAAAGKPLSHSSRSCVRVISLSETNPQQDKSSASPPRLGGRLCAYSELSV